MRTCLYGVIYYRPNHGDTRFKNTFLILEREKKGIKILKSRVCCCSALLSHESVPQQPCELNLTAFLSFVFQLSFLLLLPLPQIEIRFPQLPQPIYYSCHLLLTMSKENWKSVRLRLLHTRTLLFLLLLAILSFDSCFSFENEGN